MAHGLVSRRRLHGIYGDSTIPEVSIRVDDHPDALNELKRIYEVSLGDFSIFKQFIPTAENPAGITDRSKLEEARAAFARRQNT